MEIIKSFLYYRGLGDSAWEKDDVEKAIVYYKKEISIIEKESLDTNTLRLDENLFVSFYQLAEYYEQEDDYEKTVLYYSKVIKIRKKRIAVSETKKEKRSLALDYEEVGRIHEDNLEQECAIKAYKASEKILAKLIAEGKEPRDKQILVRIYTSLAYLNEEKDIKSSIAYRKKAIALCEETLKELITFELLKSLWRNAISLSIALEKQGREKESEKYYEKAKKVREEAEKRGYRFGRGRPKKN